jgi:hypothetical protein
VKSSGSLGDAAEPDASGADADFLVHARDYSVHALDIGIPTPPPGIVGVAHNVSIVRPFAAEITLQCHDSSCFSCIFSRVSR